MDLEALREIRNEDGLNQPITPDQYETFTEPEEASLIGNPYMLAGIAVAVALPLSLLLGSAIRSQLFGISSSDPLSLIAATLLIVLVALVAASLPAGRAAKVNPIVALRYE